MPLLKACPSWFCCKFVCNCCCSSLISCLFCSVSGIGGWFSSLTKGTSLFSVLFSSWPVVFSSECWFSPFSWFELLWIVGSILARASFLLSFNFWIIPFMRDSSNSPLFVSNGFFPFVSKWRSTVKIGFFLIFEGIIVILAPA